MTGAIRGKLAEARQAKGTPASRRRLSPDERERQIVQEAIRFFAEVGFAGQTRELAKRLGVTQPLLYRYFPTKKDLVERVYRDVYLNRWKPEWEDWIRDRDLPIAERLKKYYRSYHRVIINYEWMRIFFQAGLRGVDINQRYLKLVEERILRPTCEEIRRELSLPFAAGTKPTMIEQELFWGLHGSVIYYGVRKFIYGLPVPNEFDQAIDAKVDVFISGLTAILPALLGRDRRDLRRGKSGDPLLA